ncbi:MULTISPECIES: cation acetate symporter [Ralstonia]|jgi:cation/acetate symporter|uniref:SSS sodium solute transporter n=1 Tax=Ralstonia pickettii OR214 TaxID=1264675 RepID=R0CR37_RALPI|nr:MULTISPECIES: cation acetate symporter [Ralstonia]ENZ79076.1 SSS sodium solute transporter [Ralstonia pickettii OR214]MBL4778699.1 cation acetate symporter [Ralstonia sp.]MCM3580649.1 cation acetate symporter [Ralstonia pickettii]MDR9385693.1 cation acetate symporter [Ralstonia sp. 11b]OYU22926.1 MAG: cation acetate symporter [Ralstonia sp. PBBBR1]
MNFRYRPTRACARTLALASLAAFGCFSQSAHAAAAGAVAPQYRWLAFAAFASMIVLTLVVTYFSARRGQSAAEFYTAGGGISGMKNGFAIAGDYLSAAAFLGVSGLIAIYGFDGMLYVAGFFIAFIPILLLIAEPCRNLGRYTFGDVLACRNGFRASKLVAAVSSVIVSVCYLIPQIVGGAVLVRALIGIEYEVSVIATGALMMVYVVFGGMRATTWVQIIKAVLLITTCFVMVVLSWSPFGFSANALFDALTQSTDMQAHVAQLTGSTTDVQRFFEPGLYLKNPVEQISLGLALILGTAGMPHILMRFFTVPDARAARSSVLWGMLLIGGCHLLIIAIGFAAAYYVGAVSITALDKGGNLAAPLLAQMLAGGANTAMGNLAMAMVAAIAFATIVAVVAGLTLAASSALAHDVYVGAIKGGTATPREQLVAAKLAAIGVGMISICIGLLAKGQNVAQLVSLALAVAASANLPALLLTLYWKRCNTIGVVLGVLGGTICAIGLVLVSPNMSYPVLQQKEVQRTLVMAETELATLSGLRDRAPADDVRMATTRKTIDEARTRLEALRAGSQTSIVGLSAPLINLRNPGLISIPFGFLLVILGSFATSAETDPRVWQQLRLRRYTGRGRSEATSH